MRAARALPGIDQNQLAEMFGGSQPMIQRMEVREGNVRGVLDTLTKVIEAFECAKIDLIGENARSEGADAESVSGAQPHHQAITPSDSKQKLRDGDRRPRDDPSTTSGMKRHGTYGYGCATG